MEFSHFSIVSWNIDSDYEEVGPFSNLKVHKFTNFLMQKWVHLNFLLHNLAYNKNGVLGNTTSPEKMGFTQLTFPLVSWSIDSDYYEKVGPFPI